MDPIQKSTRMKTILNYVPTNVGPSRLEEILAGAPEMTDENKEKVSIIQDIAKLGKLLCYKNMTAEHFYSIYEMPVTVLEGVQIEMQAEWNTVQYNKRLREL